MNSKSVRVEQLALNEVEFEWIRQFFVQGAVHYELHTWWHEPIKVLLSFWLQLELRTKIVLQALEDAASVFFFLCGIFKI
jgi:alpha-ketoglutarate-dependent dioxygenase FTO